MPSARGGTDASVPPPQQFLRNCCSFRDTRMPESALVLPMKTRFISSFKTGCGERAITEGGCGVGVEFAATILEWFVLAGA